MPPVKPNSTRSEPLGGQGRRQVLRPEVTEEESKQAPIYELAQNVYRCCFCSMRSTRAANVKRHQQRHAAPKFACRWGCGYHAYRQDQPLKKHEESCNEVVAAKARARAAQSGDTSHRRAAPCQAPARHGQCARQQQPTPSPDFRGPQMNGWSGMTPAVETPGVVPSYHDDATIYNGNSGLELAQNSLPTPPDWDVPQWQPTPSPPLADSSATGASSGLEWEWYQQAPYANDFTLLPVVAQAPVNSYDLGYPNSFSGPPMAPAAASPIIDPAPSVFPPDPTPFGNIIPFSAQGPLFIDSVQDTSVSFRFLAG